VLERPLGLALVCHVAFTICRSWLAGRPPFFGAVELLSWFALCCGALCLFGSRRFASNFVIAFGVSCASAITLALGISYRGNVLPGILAVRDIRVWWYGFASPLAYAAGVLAFAAQLRGILAIGRGTKSGGVNVLAVNEENMNSLALSLVRFCYPLLLSGLVAFAISSLDAVGRAWFWQRSIAAQLFTIVAYSVYMHLCSSAPARRGRIIVAQFAAFSGVVVSVLSFELPQGFLRGLGLSLFL
jgi:ABC-type transport system involved in cytochrome c biogenesis permease subunit